MNTGRNIDYERMLNALSQYKLMHPTSTDEEMIRAAIDGANYDYPNDKKLSISDVQTAADWAIKALRHQTDKSEEYMLNDMYSLTDDFMRGGYVTMNLTTVAAIALLEATFNYMKENATNLMLQEAAEIGREMSAYKGKDTASTRFHRGITQSADSYIDMLSDLMETYHERIDALSRSLADAIRDTDCNTIAGLTNAIVIYSDAIELCSQIIINAYDADAGEAATDNDEKEGD